MACVYIHINKINNKKYVGFSKADNPDQRWGQAGLGYEGQKFYNEGILPFGWDNFIHKPLIKDISISLAKTVESLLIDRLDLINNGYNEDKGVVYENDKEAAACIVENLLTIINKESKASILQNLSDIINVKYIATTVSYRLEYLYDLYIKQRINTSLDCQREYVWDDKRQQGMWDTLLYGHRIPEVHAIRRPNGNYDIIDGKQRLLTLMKIIDNQIPLKRNFTSEEIKQYMTNNNIANLYFKDLDEVLKNKILGKELAVAEYTNVTEEMLVALFQKLNAGKPLSDFQKCIANNIVVRIRYTEYYEHNDFIRNLFSSAELAKNEDEICLIRCLSTLNCGNINNVDSLVQRELEKIIKRMDVRSLIKTREIIDGIIEDFKKLSITPEELSKINKTWYPVLFKFFNEDLNEEDKHYFKNFISYIKIPPQRGEESSKSNIISRYFSIKKDWKEYIAKVRT